MEAIFLTQKDIKGMIGALARARVAYAQEGRLDLSNKVRDYEDTLLPILANNIVLS